MKPLPRLWIVTRLEAKERAIHPGMELMKHEVPRHHLREAHEFRARGESVFLSKTRSPYANWARHVGKMHQDMNVALLVHDGRSREEIH